MKKSCALLFFCVIIFSACNKKNNYRMVSCFAGSGTMGSANGRGSAASFSNMMGIATDKKGYIYVADSRNNRIRKISPEGDVTTLAGSGAVGSADGRSDTASFFFPRGVAVDGRGNVYVADTHNGLIRKISPDGFVTTLAGSRIYTTIPAKDSIKRFDNPAGIAVDESGNVYITDGGNDLIRKISPEGKVFIIAGNGTPGAKDGPGISASFYLPAAITLDSAGNIYIADTYNNMIRKISAAGLVSTLAGKTARGYSNGKGSEASFSHPAGIAVDADGSVYVADEGNNRIRKIEPDGTVTTIAGNGNRGSANGRDTTASFYRPNGIAIDKAGHIFVADYLNNQIRRIN